MVGFKKMQGVFLGVILSIVFSACSQSEGKSAQLYETAQFEEEQFNQKHAKQLYEEILKKYPESSSAAKAKRRLEVMNLESP